MTKTIQHRPSTLWAASLCALLGVAAPIGAHANIFKKAAKAVDKEVKKDTKAVEKTATSAANATEKAAQSGANTVEKGATSAADATAKGATSAANTVANGATSIGGQAIGGLKRTFSQQEVDALADSARRSFDRELKDANALLQKGLDEAKRLYQAAEEALLRSAAERYLSRFNRFLGDMHGRVDALQASDDAMTVVKRLVRSAAERRFDKSTADDIQQIGEVLGLIEGLADSIVPGESGGAFKSSWGVALGVRGLAQVGAGQVGGDGVVGFIAASQAEPGKPLAYSFFVQPGLVFGAGEGQPIAGGLMFFWMPGTPEEAQSLRAGLTGSFTVRLTKEKADPNKVDTTLTIRRDAATGRVVRGAPRPGPNGTMAPGRLAFVRGADVASGGTGALATGVTAAAGSGIGLGLTVGVLWKVLQDPFKGGLSWPRGATAGVPGFYIQPTVSARGGFNVGIQVSQMFVDDKLLKVARTAGSNGAQ